jgi:hypothetical protein
MSSRMQEPLTAEVIVRAIAEIGLVVPSPRIRQDIHDAKEQYTRELFRILSNLGSRYGCDTYTDRRFPSCLTCRPKPPFDLIWRKGTTLILACESEWLYSIDKIMDDFIKLPYDGRATFKLLVHRNENEELIPEIRSCLARYGRHKAGEEYIVVRISNFMGALEAVSFWIPKNGPLDEDQIHFAPVGKGRFHWAAYNRTPSASQAPAPTTHQYVLQAEGRLAPQILVASSPTRPENRAQPIQGVNAAAWFVLLAVGLIIVTTWIIMSR